MVEWGDGHSTANSPEEAEALWQAVKKKEKSETKENRAKGRSPPLKSILDLVTVKDLIVENIASHSTSAASSLLLGFVVGILVTKKGIV